jgi:hypothetical protein
MACAPLSTTIRRLCALTDGGGALGRLTSPIGGCRNARFCSLLGGPTRLVIPMPGSLTSMDHLMSIEVLLVQSRRGLRLIESSTLLAP